MEDTKLEFRENALKAIAKKAINLKTGARGLRSIIENILMDTMFDLPLQKCGKFIGYHKIQKGGESGHQTTQSVALSLIHN